MISCPPPSCCCTHQSYRDAASYLLIGHASITECDATWNRSVCVSVRQRFARQVASVFKEKERERNKKTSNKIESNPIAPLAHSADGIFSFFEKKHKSNGPYSNRLDTLLHSPSPHFYGLSVNVCVARKAGQVRSGVPDVSDRTTTPVRSLFFASRFSIWMDE